MKHTLLWIFPCLLVALIPIAAQCRVTATGPAPAVPPPALAAAPPASTPPPTPVLVLFTPTPTPTPTSTPTPTPVPTTMPALTPVTWQRPTDGMVMVYVPEGEFLMGSPAGEGDDNEHPLHTVYLDAYWIDRTEVTNAQYRRCLEAGACTQPDYWGNSDFNQDAQPVVGVDWWQAKAYCQWAGVRLPTDAEWEKAARGTDGRKYPWGNQAATCQYAVMDDGSGDGCGQGDKAWPVGSKPAGASPYGVLDMAGNTSEWVADWYATDYYSRSPARNPQGPDSTGMRGIRSCSWSSGAACMRSALRYGLYPDLRTGGPVGLRCAVVTSSL